MGWSYGIDGNGREVGYSIVAQCDHPKCRKIIDRGLDYRCGPLGSETDSSLPGCGGFFCHEHLYWSAILEAAPGGGFCEACLGGVDEPDEPMFACPKCGKVSYNSNDIEYGYCGNCHTFTGPQHVPPLTL